MRRRPLALLALTLIIAGCGGSGSEDAEAAYYQSASRVTAAYESAAGDHFAMYRTALEAATAETGDEIFVTASQGLFAGLAVDLESAVAGLGELEPPDELAAAHDAWVSAAQALNIAVQETDDGLAPLTDADDVDGVLRSINLGALQEDYRAACRTVRDQAPATEPVIACQPPESS